MVFSIVNSANLQYSKQSYQNQKEIYDYQYQMDGQDFTSPLILGKKSNTSSGVSNKENVMVAIRIRPPFQHEIDDSIIGPDGVAISRSLLA